MPHTLEDTIARIIVNSSSAMAHEIAGAVRQAVSAALAGTSAGAPALRGPGRPRKTAAPLVAAPAAPRAKATAAKPSVATPPKKRSWPICSAKGCGGKFFPPSGTERRLCYKHFLEAGGVPPLAKVKNPAKRRTAR